MIKSGKVMNVKEDKVYILTDDNEFAIVKIGNKLPIKGKRYSGYEFFNIGRAVKILIFLLLAVSLSIFIYFVKYTNSDSSFIVDMNTQMKISVNSENKIVSIKPMDSRSEKIIEANSFFNKEYNEVLMRIYSICVAKDFYLDKPKRVNIFIDSKLEESSLDFTPFKDYVEYRNYTVTINENGHVD